MNYIYLKARAKINVGLDVLRKREDNYHEIRTIMQTINLYDNLFIKRNRFTDKIILDCNLNWLPTNEKNLAYKAAQYMKERYNIKDGIYIELQKNIPISAGLAGGSADCAATLIGIRRLFKINIPQKEILKIGKSLGADVPFCILRGTALSENIGDKLTKLPNHPNILVLVVRPTINVSTAGVFNKLDLKNIKERPNIDLIIKHIKSKNIKGITSNFCNVLETVTAEEYPIIKTIKNTMMQNNALGSLMSGSGPSVFGYYKNIIDIKKTIKEIKMVDYRIKEIFITTIYTPKIHNKWYNNEDKNSKKLK